MAIQCMVILESACAFYTIKSICYDTYKAFLKKDKKSTLQGLLPATLTIKKRGQQWEGNNAHPYIIQELGAAIDYRIQNDLYERLY